MFIGCAEITKLYMRLPMLIAATRKSLVSLSVLTAIMAAPTLAHISMAL